MADMEKEHSYYGDFMTWLMDRLSQVTNAISIALPAYVRQIWEDFLKTFALPAYVRQIWEEFLNTLYLHVTPGEKFGREAIYVFVVGTVPAFLVGSTSAALLLGVAPGFIAGMGLMVAFNHCQRTRSRARRLKAGLIITLSDLTKDDIQSIFSKSLLPRWIVFSELEKVDWLNQQLKKVWPYFNEAYSRMLMDTWEPYLDFYKPTLATSISFQELTLGSVAPQLGGVRMLDLVEKEVSMDVEMRWNGNASCILSVATIMGVSLPVQVKDINMKVVLRCIFKPLVDELPGFGALSYSIRKKKKFEFKLKFIGGDIATVPGLAEKLHDMISTAVIESLCWPMRICIPIIPTPADGDYTRLQRHLCPRRNGAVFTTLGAEGTVPVGILDVKLVQARDLRHSEKTPDPFAMLYIHATPGRMRRSTTIRNEDNPIWNEIFEVEVEDMQEQKLMIILLDDSAAQEFQVLGYAQFYLQALEEGQITERWLKLFKNIECHGSIHDTKYRGQINVELLHRSYDEQEVEIHRAMITGASTSSELEKWHESRSKYLSARLSRKGKLWEMIRGVLTVTVTRAEDLLPTDFNGKSDPYVVLNMRKHKRCKKKTTVVPKNLNPVWQEKFHFLVEDASQDMLMAKDFLGSMATTLTRVLREAAFDGIFRLVGVPCGRLFLRLEWNDKRTDGSYCSDDAVFTHSSECNSIL